MRAAHKLLEITKKRNNEQIYIEPQKENKFYLPNKSSERGVVDYHPPNVIKRSYCDNKHRLPIQN